MDPSTPALRKDRPLRGPRLSDVIVVGGAGSGPTPSAKKGGPAHSQSDQSKNPQCTLVRIALCDGAPRRPIGLARVR